MRWWSGKKNCLKKTDGCIPCRTKRKLIRWVNQSYVCTEAIKNRSHEIEMTFVLRWQLWLGMARTKEAKTEKGRVTPWKALINFCALCQVLLRSGSLESDSRWGFVCRGQFSGKLDVERNESIGRQRERLNSDAVATGSHLIQWELWNWGGPSKLCLSEARGRDLEPSPRPAFVWSLFPSRVCNFEQDGSLLPRALPGERLNYALSAGNTWE